MGCLIVVALFAIVFFLWGPALLLLGVLHGLFSTPWGLITGLYFLCVGIKTIYDNMNSERQGVRRIKLRGRSGPKRPWMSMEDHYLESKRRREEKRKEEEENG